MEIALLLEITDFQQAVVYSPQTKKDYSVELTADQAELYQSMLESIENDEDVYVHFDKENMQLTYLDSE
ncbi:YebC/PmpR family DNA-binding transcriptional regulator [Marinilactibacillus psychrotolerans]|nr:YebC/PmpR family DNA-binding transcriptional regulator [Marinilactibacillus psychrotolerans]TLQ07033.1 YebC/PmpR family DNA-binding transcriptional regulator [Marinilactibacillus psychrotolerans]